MYLKNTFFQNDFLSHLYANDPVHFINNPIYLCQ